MPAPPGATAEISSGRRRLALALVALVAAMQGVAMVSYRELLPFSPFPMFSYIQSDYRASVLNAYAVSADRGNEIPLMPSRSITYTFPLDGRLLQWSFERIATQADAPEAFGRALRDLYERYERGRARGRHAGPPIRAVRLYRENWTLRFDLANADQADSRSLVAEYVPPAG